MYVFFIILALKKGLVEEASKCKKMEQKEPLGTNDPPPATHKKLILNKGLMWMVSLPLGEVLGSLGNEQENVNNTFSTLPVTGDVENMLSYLIQFVVM